MSLESELEALVRRVVREEIAAALAGRGTPEHATAKKNPLGSERGFLAAARRGAFATFRLGRQVAARWADVQAYAESRTIARAGAHDAPAQKEGPLSDDERRRRALEAAGVVLRRPRSSKRTR